MGSQSVVLEPAASTISPGNLEIQVLRLLQIQKLRRKLRDLSYCAASVGSESCQSWRTTFVGRDN